MGIYDSDSLQLIFSSGKSVASILMAMMVDQGLLDYDNKVTDYWPEFGKNDKDKLRVKDILRHQCGMQFLKEQIHIDDLTTEGIKANKVGEVIENDYTEQPKIKKNEGTEIWAYHRITRDWITNEIFRRVEPKGRTMGEYMKEGILPKFIGSKGIYFGVPEN